MTTPNMYEFDKIPLVKSLKENTESIERILGKTSDLLSNPFRIGDISCCLFCFEGMISTQTITNLLLVPLTELSDKKIPSPQKLFDHIKDNMLLTTDRGMPTEYGDLILRLMSGFAILLIDGMDTAFAFGVQGYETRSINEPSSEGNIRGSHEGFVETVRTSMSLVRRRIKSPLLRFELFSVTKTSHVDVILAYMADRVPMKLVKRLRKRLEELPLETILGSGYAAPFLDDVKPTLFSGVSVTERPDVFCAKILEGRVGLLIEGTPFALVIPSLFIENFQTLDDYNFRPFYAFMIRWIRYLAFFLAVFLPAVYVAMVTFHPELFNHALLVTLAAAEQTAPLPLAVEAVIVLLFYEIIREAGVRLPKSVGGAVSIVGGLIIGDAAVSAGIISNPLLLACAISVTASFVIPALDQPVTVLRFIAVIMGGICGLYGISLLAAVMLVNICSLENQGVPVMSPISPFTPKAMRDVLIRIGFKKMAKGQATVEKLHGANMNQGGDEPGGR
ncbi:MAG: spore germination protein [Oscillospiraceae bacterium]|nr:spore germination protein [Oscillospiraceae bacterium]